VRHTDDVAAKRRTVLQACVARFGHHRGGFAAAHVAQLAITAAGLGRLPTAVEYADDWAIDERTAWRHRAEARAALGDDWETVVVQLAGRLGERRTPRAVLGLTAPALTA
jgi:hypothetical protein